MILPCAKFHGFDTRFFIIHITQSIGTYHYCCVKTYN